MGRLLVFSGAGISADSGVATFRTGSALWEDHDVDVVCNEWTWKRNFDLVHRFYNDRRMSLAAVAPNAAHLTVAAWMRDLDAVNLTQNVDDLFERAGCRPDEVVHLHGRLTEMACTACGAVRDIGHRAWDAGSERCGMPKGGDVCACRKGMRPNVVFFNGAAPLYASMYAAFGSLEADDVLVVCGTSGLVIDVDALVFDAPCLKIRCDLTASGKSFWDVDVAGRASDVLPALDEIVRSRARPRSPDAAEGVAAAGVRPGAVA